MKFKTAQLKNGRYAVASGKSYFPSTETELEVDAKIRACELSAQWYMDKINECNIEWERLHELKGEEVDCYDWGNVLA